jgi:hypothetical protein
MEFEGTVHLELHQWLPLVLVTHQLHSIVQIAISSRGILKVTHMLTLSGGGPLHTEVPLLGSLASQVDHAQHMCIPILCPCIPNLAPFTCRPKQCSASALLSS